MKFLLSFIILSVSVFTFAQSTLPLRDTLRAQDIDGNYYNTVKIGRQVWMADNLRVTRYSDGKVIPNVTGNEEWGTLYTGSYAWYGNDSAAYAADYGALYNWYAVNTGRLCPSGWHVPSDEEWKTMMYSLGGFKKAGGRMKETDTLHWDFPNTGATNESGFSAVPGGGRASDGVSGNLGLNGFFWCSAEYDENYAWMFNLSYFYPNLYMGCYHKRNGFSVRCIMD